MNADTLNVWVQRLVEFDPFVIGKLLSSIITVFILLVLRWLVSKIALRRIENLRIRYQWQKFSGYITFALIVLIVGRVWTEGIKSLATFLGLFSAGLAIALKDLFVNLAGWIFILIRRPFGVGDRIQIGNYAGDVVDVRLFQFTLMEIGNWVDADQNTGRIIHIPNGKVFTESLANYNQGWFRYIWNEIPVLVTFESNWGKAKEILKKVTRKHADQLSETALDRIKEASRNFMTFEAKLAPTVYTSVEDFGVLLTIRYLCEPRRRRETTQSIWEGILGEFSRSDDIDFAYPTERRFDNLSEGKTGTQPASEEKQEAVTENKSD
jgi:small-conductance mechanosensitive channel